MASFLTQVGGFTPVIDIVANDIGLMSANVYGVVWRCCRERSGTCKTSLKRVAWWYLDIDRKTAERHIKKLCAAGYLHDLTTNQRNGPYTCADTGRFQCSWCLKEAKNLINHHWPIPRCEGGENTVGICPDCHTTCHAGFLVIDCTSATNDDEYKRIYQEALMMLLKRDFPGLGLCKDSPIPYAKTLSLNPIWMTTLPEENHQEFLDIVSDLKKIMEP